MSRRRLKFWKKNGGVRRRKFFHSQRMLMLQAIDMLWVEHLEAMDYMRSSVRLRAYGQKDPLVEYKNEGRGLSSEWRGFHRQRHRRNGFESWRANGEPKQEPILKFTSRPDDSKYLNQSGIFQAPGSAKRSR